jgi:hypothetical protein
MEQPRPGRQAQSAVPHERHPHPCQRAYGNFRRRILETLAHPPRNRIISGLQRIARAGFLILDAPTRWLMDLFDAISGNRGYLAIGSVVAAYLAAFGLIDTKSTQEETRAALERSVFITLVSSGNAASFVAAMKDFGSTQTMPATKHPSLLKFWDWGRPHQPNRESMWRWALWRLELCSKEKKDCILDDASLPFVAGDGGRINLVLANLSGTKLSGTHLSDANLSFATLTNANLIGGHLNRAYLTGANLTGANLTNADLTGALLSQATLTGANLTDATLGGANLSGANLSGANLSALDLFRANLRGAKFSPHTQFPLYFDPKAAGMVLTAN